MAIISISVDEEMLSDLEHARLELGFSGRSEAIRAGMRMLLEEMHQEKRLKGKFSAVLLIVHPHDAEKQVSEIKHRFEEIVKTQVHSHLRDGKCLEIFMLEGDAKKMGEMARLFRTNGKIGNAKLIAP
jgi:CopG family nickel-responsive transcriptional regulator